MAYSSGFHTTPGSILYTCRLHRRSLTWVSKSFSTLSHNCGLWHKAAQDAGRFPHKHWHEEKLPWLLKASAVLLNCYYPKISRISRWPNREGTTLASGRCNCKHFGSHGLGAELQNSRLFSVCNVHGLHPALFFLTS